MFDRAIRVREELAAGQQLPGVNDASPRVGPPPGEVITSAKAVAAQLADAVRRANDHGSRFGSSANEIILELQQAGSPNWTQKAQERDAATFANRCGELGVKLAER